MDRPLIGNPVRATRIAGRNGLGDPKPVTVARVVTHPLWRPYNPRAGADRRPYRVAQRQTPVAGVVDHDPTWPSDFETIGGVVLACLGSVAISVRHVGSTAVPGLAAKPIIDVDLLVPDVQDEPSYLPRLESVGFRLTFRDPIAGDAHRQLTYADPNTNLHVFSVGAVEAARHAMFVEWMRMHKRDRDAYGALKARLTFQDMGAFDYNGAKSAMVYDIYERIFAADAAHPHRPRPRSSITDYQGLGRASLRPG